MFDDDLMAPIFFPIKAKFKNIRQSGSSPQIRIVITAVASGDDFKGRFSSEKIILGELDSKAMVIHWPFSAQDVFCAESFWPIPEDQ